MQHRLPLQALLVVLLLGLYWLYGTRNAPHPAPQPAFQPASQPAPQLQVLPWQHAKFASRMTTKLHLPYEEFGGVLEQSENDPREHRLIRLPNNLVAVCTRDPDATTAAAVLSVNVGHFVNPPELPGLAHFLEHMLFMGSEKYPGENEYTQFLTNNSGSHNAYTSDTQTTYFFDIPNGALEGALDRFSRFFIDPLLAPGAIDREVHAVDSEYKGNLRHDGWRIQHLLAALSDQSHPYSHFKIGSLETLRDAARERGLDLREEVARLHKQYYSADIMKLSIVGNYSMDQLVEWAVSKFADVASKGVTKPQHAGHPMGSGMLGKAVHFETVGDHIVMNVLFALPELKAMYATKPLHYIMSLLQRDGPGSLRAYLKAKGWLAYIHGHPGDSDYDGFNMLPIGIGLTPTGLEHYEDVLRALFAYLQMLAHHGPQQWIHDERRVISDLEFKHFEKPGSLEWAEFLASEGHNEYMAPEHFLTKDGLVREFDAEAVTAMLRLLNPQNYSVLIGAQKHSTVRCDRQEKYFGTPYHVADLPTELAAGLAVDWRKPYGFHLPARNSFLPQSTAVVTTKAPPAEIAPAPTLLRLTNSTEVWFKQDDQFLEPRGNIRLQIDIPRTSTSALNAVAAKLLDKCIGDVLNRELYAARRAGAWYSFSYAPSSIVMAVDGFSDKLPHLLETLVQQLRSFVVEEHTFNTSLAALKQDHQNTRYMQPYQQLNGRLSGELNYVPVAPLSALEEAAGRVTIGDVQALADSVFDQAYTTMLVAGNFDESDALAAAARVADIMGARPMPSYLRAPPRTVDIEPGHYLRRERAQDEGSPNSAVLSTIYLGPTSSMKERMVATLLGRIVGEPFFDQLRTKEQLGYAVKASNSGFRNGREALKLLVQGEANPEYLTQRVDEFLRSFRQYLVEYSAADFATLVDAVVSGKLEKLKTVSDEAKLFWAYIQGGRYDFDRVSREVACLRGLGKEDLLEAWDRYVDPATAAQHTRVDSHLWSAAAGYPADADLEAYPAATVALLGCLESEGLAGVGLAELDRFVQTTSLAGGLAPALEELRALYTGQLAASTTADLPLDRIAADGSRIGTALEMALAAAGGAARPGRSAATNFANIGMRRTPDGKWIIHDVDAFKATQRLHGLAVPAIKLVPKHAA
ncbi:metalloprotease [Coemansia biformis]|uniref:Metalloprotease n=1 Tax=Coemansia biformis TaxID=1286918 RepID=A0A9W7YAR1_9FUNG|nr:metalloprotease [Coemansia biformis]